MYNIWLWLKGTHDVRLWRKGKHSPSPIQKFTNAAVDIGQLDGKGEVGLDLYGSCLAAMERLRKKKGTTDTIWAASEVAG